MDASDKRFSELVDIVKSWIPRRAEPAHISRVFWMPDHSCRVCYECDSQFTILNRRHHCRLCGRVFCAKCTSNSVPAPSDERKGVSEEWERIRVCNYCFKQWEREKVVIDNGICLSSPTLSPSPSATSLASTKSSITGNSSNNTSCSMAYSSGPNQQMQCEPCLSPGQSATMGNDPEDQDDPTSGRHEKSIEYAQERSSDQFSFCLNRSDDEDDDFGVSQSDSERRHFEQQIQYYDQVQYNDHENDYVSHKIVPALDNLDSKDSGSIIHEDLNSQDTTVLEKYVGDTKIHYSGENIDVTSSMYGIDSSESEPVDFENNGLLWLPPDPEDEEDDREPVIFDDDDEEDAPGEWKSLRSSGSFGNGEYRCKDRSSEEHRKAMKNVVEGHFRALVAQLLQVEDLPAGDDEDNESWLDIITFLSWEAATLLKPDMSKGGGMDPGGYVKVKCVACGRRRDSEVVKGVVCKKNVAHRRMTAKIKNPRFMILGGALEYQRVSNLLSSFDTLLQQEMDHLKMAVAKIDAHHPHVLLVEKAVSRYAQEYLLAKDISLVLNIKRPLLERIVRCTGAQIVPSIDHLSSQKLGHCENFHVDKYVEEHGTAGQDGKKLVKTLMFFEGCPKPLGCTILLKGANGDELKKVKHVVQYGIFAAYHLALETSFLADEGASLPELPLQSPITVALPDKASSFDRSISTIPGFTSLPPSQPISRASSRSSIRDLPEHSPDKIEEMVILKGSNIQNFDSSSSTGATSPSSSNPKQFSTENGDIGCTMGVKNTSSSSVEDITRFQGKNTSEMENQNNRQYGHEEELGIDTAMVVANEGADSKNQLVASDASQLQQEVKDVVSQMEEFPPSPSDHQSILVSLSTRCVWKGTVCERAHLFRIKYYGSFDKPLGRFLRDHLFDQSFRCNSCDKPTEAHVHCYTHRQGSLTISVKKLPDLLLPGQRDGKIWMWHRCLKCPRDNGFPPATRRIVMSDAAWGLSFGKFLELSFSNHAAASRVASCGHSLHRDCLRFYGFGNMVACFRYASIDVHSVYLPPSKLDFNYQPQEWIKREAEEVVVKAEFFFSEVLNTLNKISERKAESGVDALHNMNSVEAPESRRHRVDLEKLLQKEKHEFEEYFEKVLNREPRKGELILDILEINKLRRQLILYSYMWDCRLKYAAILANGSPEDLGHSFLKQKEKPTPVERLAEMSTSLKTRSLTSGEILLEQKNSDLRVMSSPVGFKTGVDELDVNNLKGSIDQIESVEASGPVRRTLSEGQFPVTTSLSDTLDAAWTGETTPTRPPENDLIPVSGPPITESSIQLESVLPPAEAEHLSEAEAEAVQTSGPRISDESDCVHDLKDLNGAPFLSFYSSYENSLRSNAQMLEFLAEYNPVYVSSFRDLGRYGGARLFIPLGVNDTVIPIYDDEPTSIIAYVLVSSDYHSQMSGEREKLNSFDSFPSLPSVISGSFYHGQSFDETSSESVKSFGSTEDSLTSLSSRSSLVVDPLFDTKALHSRVAFTDPGPLGKVKYSVTCYYAKRFEALRRISCPSEIDFVRSLSRCKKWGAQGGKSNVFFAKTLDDRFIIKQVTKTELESFIKFAPEYFKYLSESIGTGSPTCLAKILGIYQVSSKHLKGGKESRMDVLVMENLLFGRNVTRLYDLKGSSRSRYNPDSSGSNKVLLDQNLIESMPTSPIFVGNKAKRLLERAVWNDTSFLASIDVMDYSLLAGVDEEKHELVLGIIDFMRQYTWDKHLETWVKASGILGGTKNSSPTVISPKQYKKRFRKAMSAYFLMVPDQWSSPTIIPSRSQSDLNEDNQSSSQE